MSAKNAFSNALGFFKAQKTEEKKIIDENKFVKEVKKSEKEEGEEGGRNSKISRLLMSCCAFIGLNWKSEF